MLKRLLTALLLKDIPWWEWKGRVKCVLWLSMVLGMVGWGPMRLEESGDVGRTYDVIAPGD
jgi:hypothetical protein